MNQSILVNDLIAIPNLQLFVIESKIIIEINIWIKGDKQPSDLFSFLFFQSDWAVHSTQIQKVFQN